jgi:glutamine synthetase type III
MEEVRNIYDKLELVLPDKIKPFPNYDDLLFLTSN